MPPKKRFRKPIPGSRGLPLIGMSRKTPSGRKPPVRHRVKSHTRKSKQINSFIRGRGIKRPIIHKRRLCPTEPKLRNLVLGMEKLKHMSWEGGFLIIPSGGRTDWRENMGFVKTWGAAVRLSRTLVEQGFDEAKILVDKPDPDCPKCKCATVIATVNKKGEVV